MRKLNFLAAACLLSAAAMAQQPTLGIRQLSPAELGRAQHAAPATLAPQALPQGGGPRLSAPLKAKAPQARAEALGEGERYVGYYGGDWDYYFSLDTLKVSMATHYDAGLCKKYVGDPITRISADFGNAISECTLWIAETLGGPRLAEVEIPAGDLPGAMGGNVEVQLETPVPVPAGGYYLGYDMVCLEDFKEQPEYYPISFASGAVAGSGIMLVSFDDGQSWLDYTWGFGQSMGAAALAVRTAIKSQNHSDYDLALTDFHCDRLLFDETTRADDGSFSATVGCTIMNYGFQPVQGLTIGIYANGELDFTMPISAEGGIPSLAGGLLTFPLSIPSTMNNPVFSFEIIELEGGVQDQYAANNSATLPPMRFYAPEQAAAKTPLLELYTTGQCVNCPYGHAAVKAAAATSHPAIVAHHVGFGVDAFTIEESNVYLNAFEVPGAPYAISNRSWLASDAACFFGTGYYDASEGAEEINEKISASNASVPAFATITAVPSYNPDTRTLTVNVSGTKSDAALFDYVMTAPRVHAYLTEDGLVGDQMRPGGLRGSYVDTDYVHDHVLRAILGEDAAWGVAPVWYGGNYTATFTATLDPEWVPENMNIVVFLSNEDSESPWNHAVMNAAQVNLSGKDTGISAAPAGEGFAAWGGEGRVCLSGDFRSFRVYTLQGAEVPASGLAAGIYVVAVETDGGTQVRKVAVR